MVSRVLVAAAGLAAGGGLGVGLAAAVDDEAQPPGPERTIVRDGKRTTIREVTSPWELADVGPRARTLVLFYRGGGCLLGNGRAHVRESESTIGIAVRQDNMVDVERPPGVGFACAANLKRHRLRVRLGSPVDGRRIEGGQRWDVSIGWSRLRRVPTPFGYLPLVPRVVGLSSGDATDLLGTQRFQVRTVGEPGGMVVAQRPRPGTAVRTRRRGSLPGVLGTVTIVLKDR